ncbi:MAG: conjugal transfer protein TraI [Bacteroidetes bacterium]|nr:conjugal transfer protein TraI [Bacteroidota bacterium]
MKKKLLTGAIALLLSFGGYAQIPIADIIKKGIKKVIVAVDLKIQRLQNKTIWLQNAQKAIENTMSKLKLDQISDWVEKQRKLYADYFDELSKVKEVIATYHRVKDIIDKQTALIGEYHSAWELFRQDDHFTADEINYMGKVYTGILNESIKNLDQVFLVINAFTTQMTDAKRIEIINHAAELVEENLADLRQFNDQNKMLSFQRAAEKGDIDVVKKLYGLE